MLALVIFAEKHIYLFIDMKFHWIFENASMKHIHNINLSKAIFEIWILLPASFDFEVIHKKNEHLIHADYLSRDGAKALNTDDELILNSYIPFGPLKI